MLSLLCQFLSIGAFDQRNYFIHDVNIIVCAGDIAQQKVDVIVNAANAHMLGGAGVDGAIQKAAGPQLVKYSKTHFPVVAMDEDIEVRCPVGTVQVTPSFNLASNGIRYIVHANGPQGWIKDRDHYLKSCYAESINAVCDKERLCNILPADNGVVNSIAFPAISVGIFGYPLQEATECAVAAILDTLAFHRAQGTLTLNTVKIVLFEKDQNFSRLFDLYTQQLGQYAEQMAIGRSRRFTGSDVKVGKRSMIREFFSRFVDYVTLGPVLLCCMLSGGSPFMGG